MPIRLYKNNKGLISGLGSLGKLINLNRLAAPFIPQTVKDNISEVQPEVPKRPIQTQIIIEPPTATEVLDNPPVEKNVASTTKAKKTPMSADVFVNNMYTVNYNGFIRKGHSPADADKLARYATAQQALETGYGKSVAANHNYSGIKNRKGGYQSYASPDAYFDSYYKTISKWNYKGAKSAYDYGMALHNGKLKYSETPPQEYSRRMSGVYKRTNSMIRPRKKAWIGALIGAATGIIGSALSADEQEKARHKQIVQQNYQNLLKSLAAQNEQLSLTQNAQKAYEQQFRMPFRRGGGMNNKNIYITDGGYGEAIAPNTFLLKGASHEQTNESGQTGIGIRVGRNNEIEAEGGEIVQKTPREVRVFSKEPILGGISPVDLIMMGYPKDQVFAWQQATNGNSHGQQSRCGGRHKAAFGLHQFLLPMLNAAGSILDEYGGSNGDNVKPEEETVMKLGGRRRFYTGGLNPYSNYVPLSNDDFYTKQYMNFWNWINSNKESDKAKQWLGRINNGEFGDIGGNTFNMDEIIRLSHDYKKGPVHDAFNEASKSFAKESPLKSAGIDIDALTRPKFKGFATDISNAGKITKEDLATLQEKLSLSGINGLPFRRNRLGMDITTGDWIGLGANILGGGLSWLINRNAIKNMKSLGNPYLAQPGKLVTTYNINPQLAAIERAREAMINDSMRNTSSGVAGLDRRNLINLEAAEKTSEQWGEKFNKEATMLNEDTKNQQQIGLYNAHVLNNFLKTRFAYDNERDQLAAENNIGLVQGLGDAVNKFIAQGQQRYEDNNALGAYIAASHPGTAAIMNMHGVDIGPRNERNALYMAKFNYDKAKASGDKKAIKDAEFELNYWMGRTKGNRRYRLFS